MLLSGSRLEGSDARWPGRGGRRGCKVDRPSWPPSGSTAPFARNAARRRRRGLEAGVSGLKCRSRSAPPKCASGAPSRSRLARTTARGCLPRWRCPRLVRCTITRPPGHHCDLSTHPMRGSGGSGRRFTRLMFCATAVSGPPPRGPILPGTEIESAAVPSLPTGWSAPSS